jgi:DNA polymerase-1
VLIASSDKDFTQLVNDRIRLLRSEGKETTYVDATAVFNRHGVRPDQMVDYLSLLGDTVDNIPGVPGIGEKTAAELLRAHGSIDQLLANVATIPTKRHREALLTAADRLRLNRHLVALRCDLPDAPDLEALAVHPPDEARLRTLFSQFGFKSLLAELQPQTPDLFATS